MYQAPQSPRRSRRGVVALTVVLTWSAATAGAVAIAEGNDKPSLPNLVTNESTTSTSTTSTTVPDNAKADKTKPGNAKAGDTMPDNGKSDKDETDSETPATPGETDGDETPEEPTPAEPTDPEPATQEPSTDGFAGVKVEAIGFNIAEHKVPAAAVSPLAAIASPLPAPTTAAPAPSTTVPQTGAPTQPKPATPAKLPKQLAEPAAAPAAASTSATATGSVTPSDNKSNVPVNRTPTEISLVTPAASVSDNSGARAFAWFVGLCLTLIVALAAAAYIPVARARSAAGMPLVSLGDVKSFFVDARLAEVQMRRHAQRRTRTALGNAVDRLKP